MLYEGAKTKQNYGKDCLNPYSNGICSMSTQDMMLSTKLTNVLILILMEYAL